MRRLAALLRWELRLQLRALRTRAAIPLYVALCAAPGVVFLRVHSEAQGPATLLEAILEVQPFLTLVLTALVAGHRSGSAAWPETWPVLASAPLGNAGYLAGRWLSVMAVVLPVTAVPLAVNAGLATVAGCQWQGGAAWAWVGSWALRIVPLAFITAAMWLGMVTILGSELAALAATVVGVGLALAALNEIFLRFHLLVEVSPTLGAAAGFARSIFRITRPKEAAASLPATEAPFDARAVAEWAAPQMLVGAAVAALVLALAVAYVRRTRRDLPPRRVRPDHPLRTYLLLFLRLREHLAPSAALGRSDLLAMGCGVLVLAAGLGLDVERQRHYQRLAGARYEAEKGDPFAPLPSEVVPQSWSIRGEVELSGAVALEVASTLRNQGAEPRDRLAFSLNQNLEVAAVDAPGRRVAVERAWDRLRLTLEPPLAPGESLEIRWRLRGAPAEIQFPLWGFPSDAFVTRMEKFRQARFVRELSDLSLSRPIRAASPRRVGLEAASLAPVPRYTPWTLELVDRSSGPQPEIPREIVFPEAEISIDLAAPSRVFLADPCGHASRAEGGRSVLRGRCRTALAEYGVFGGRLEVQEMGDVVLATLAAHRHLVASYGETLARAARLSEKAWPGMEGIEGLVVVEWLPYFEKQLDNSGWFWGQYLLRGRLLLVGERSLKSSYLFPLGGERLIADLMTRDLIARRPIVASQELLFRRILAALMLRRMGLARQMDATVGGEPWLEQQLATPLLEAREHNWQLWEKRLPAVLADLEGRVGSQKLFDGFEEFLSRGGEAGTVEELLAVLEEEAGVPLERFYRDFIAGGAVPKLQLEGVESRRGERGFRVTGRVRNTGTGEVICPVLVKTETGAIQVTVTVDSASAAPFDVRTASRPHTVELDPGGTCHRLVTRMREAAEKVDLLG